MKRHQSRRPLVVSSGALSQRMKLQCDAGPTPYDYVEAATVPAASIEWTARSESDSRVNSSTTWRSVSTRSSAVTSNWYSRALDVVGVGRGQAIGGRG